MRDLATAIPDVAVLLALEPEELGAKLLFRSRRNTALACSIRGKCKTAMDWEQK
jgi:hypothetical protein